jgi:pimeloyl-ACP methyl ester carboxylesterase
MIRQCFRTVPAFMLVVSAASALALPGADPLPRRAALGVPLAVDAGSVIVTAVPEGSAAAEAGLLAGDTLGALDGAPVTSTTQVQSVIGSHREGDSLAIDVVRGGEQRHLIAVLKAFPHETFPNTIFEYGHVTLPDGIRLRTIVSRPANATGPAPAVLYLQGGGCGSIDAPWAGETGPNALLHAIASRGFVTMRVDKPGSGDSEGPPCAEIGFREELAGYRAALAALREHPAVDSERMYLLGVSLGGVFAPLLASETHMVGIIVWGTLAGPPPPYPGRSDRFFQEFAPIDVAGAWRKVGTRVLVLHGEYDVDPAVGGAAQDQLVAYINQGNSGSAEFHEFPHLDHCWTWHKTFEASRDNCGLGDATIALSDAVLEFLGRAG